MIVPLLQKMRVLWLGLALLVVSGCMPFQTREVRFGLPEKSFVRVGPQNRKIRIYERGKSTNPAVVFVHGYASAGLIWLPLMRTLEEAGYYCLAMDLPGFGLSDKYKGNYDTRHIADQVAEVMQKKGIDRADIVAHSWGSSVTLALALRHPRKVRRIVIHGGWVYNSQIVPVLRWSKIPAIGEMIYWLYFRERPGEKYASSFYDPDRMVNMAVVSKIKEALDRPGALAGALAVARGMNFQDMEKRYKTIRNQTLLLWGKQDRVALPFYGQRLEADLPDAQLILLDRCGHIPMLERPHLVHRYVRRFLGPAVVLARPDDPPSKQ
ncbi:MAG: alpha/beta hydrolase [Myxococcales bacterium]|nr:alpha/beta hydrolase [Myxococcales bacterium]